MALTFGQVTDILMLANGIPEARRGTFVARLKQWQKMGFPDGVKGVGRGVKVEYGAVQVYQLALHMRLLSLGLTPERSQKLVGAGWQRLADAIVMTALRKAQGDQDYCYLIIRWDALTELREPGADHDHIHVSATMDWMIADAFQGVDDLSEEAQATFEQFQLLLRNDLVNAIVLEIDSIVVRIWGAMVKLGISPTALEDMRNWMVEMSERERQVANEPIPEFSFHDSLAGVEVCPSCFAAEMLSLPRHSHDALENAETLSGPS